MKLTTIIMLTGLLLSFSRMTGQTPELPPVDKFLKWKSTILEVGEITQGKPVEVVFSFTNEGSAPIVFTAVKPSCGCTSVKYPSEPVLPGTSGEITAIYDAKTIGSFRKSISVTTNHESDNTTLSLTGMVSEM